MAKSLPFAAALCLAMVTVTHAQRVTDGLIVLYEFQEGSGTTVGDSGPGEPLDLEIAPFDLGNKVRWIANGGLSMNLGSGPAGTGGAVPIQSLVPATKIYDAIASPVDGTNELTIEAWVRPELPNLQSNISRIVTMSADPSNRNFTFGTTTTGDQYVNRLRTPGTGNNGTGGPGQLTTAAGAVQAGKLQHVVFTRDADGEEIIYVDGDLAAGPRIVVSDVVPPVGSSAATAFAEVEDLIEGVGPYADRIELSEPLLEADFHNSAGDGHFGINNPVPGLFGNDDDFAIEITGTLQVLVPGDYTFVFTGDDGGRIQIDFGDGNGLVDVIDDTVVLHPPQDWGDLVTFPEAGNYPFRCVAFERGGGATFEWMYAQGDRRLDFTNGAFNVPQFGGTAIGDNVPLVNPGPWYLLGDPLPDANDPGSNAIEVDDGEVTSYSSPIVFGASDLSNWNPSYALGLGDELTQGGRKFNGEYHLIAIYDRALDADEVLQNFEETEFSFCIPEVTRSLDPDSFDAGDTVTVTIEVTNILAATTVSDTFPPRWTVSDDGGGMVEGNTIRFSISADATLTYRLTAGRSVAGSFSGMMMTSPEGCDPVELTIAGESIVSRTPPVPPVAIPAADVAADIGFPVIPGTQEPVSDDPLAVNLWGSGADIWGTADEGRMISFGDFEEFDIRARVEFFGRHVWGKAGLMARTSIDDASSAYAFIHITGANGTDFQFRDDVGFNAANRGQTGAAGILRELRLMRREGDLIEAFARNPGDAHWEIFATREMPALAGSLVGLAITSHDNGELAGAAFEDIVISTEPPPRLEIADLECVFDEDGADLTFTPPVGAAEIEVRRQGELIGTLPGDATDHTDDDGPAFSYSVQPFDANGLPGPRATCSRREIIALYDFEEGEGDVVHDRSDFGEPYDLRIQDMAFAEWGEGFLTVNTNLGIVNTGGTILSNPGVPTTKLFDAVTATEEVSVEAWVVNERGDLTANPARIVTYSNPANGPGARHFTVGTLNAQYAARFRSTTNGNNGSGGPGGQLLADFVLPGDVQHVVFTRAADGQESLFVDGELVATRPRDGDLSNWPADNGVNYELAVGQEHGLARRWAGELYRVVVFSYALSIEEVEERFDAGEEDRPDPVRTPFVRGDTNADGDINVTDGIFVLNFLFLGGQEPSCRASIDTNNDGGENITDGVYVLNFLFLGGPDIPPPNSCGEGLADREDCVAFPPCE